MNGLLKNYRAFIIGSIIAVGLIALLSSSGASYFIVDPAYVSRPVYVFTNIIGFVVCWLIISFWVDKFPLYKILGVLALLVAASFAERYMNVSNNPLTIPLLILFWLGVAYFILPQFFKKYKIAIFVIYGLIISYYYFDFITTTNYTIDNRLNFVNFMLIPTPVFAALWIYEQWRWLRILKEDKAKAELTLLKNQINPHFFFNTLNNLYGLAVEKSDQAPAMILKLSDIMRYSIYEGKADYVPLENEVNYLEDYIELNKIRYHKQVDIDFHKDLQYAHKIAPLLLIIPLENAFKHGVESLTVNAFIELKIRTTPSTIFFQVRNNFEAKGQNHEGIGLTNLKKRLALLYPNQHQLEITKTADIYTVSLEIESHELSNHR